MTTTLEEKEPRLPKLFVHHRLSRTNEPITQSNVRIKYTRVAVKSTERARSREGMISIAISNRFSANARMH